MTPNFSHIAQTTQCPFAASAKVVSGPRWETNQPFIDNVAANATRLETFCAQAAVQEFHGFVMEIVMGESALVFDAVQLALGNVLRSLSTLDPMLSPCMTSAIDQPGWQFEFSGCKLFVSVFAPCYPPWHTKHAPGSDRIFLFFQPDFSFDFCNIDRRNVKIKAYIRNLFKDAGRPYNSAIIDKRIEAMIYMSPLSR